MNQLISLAIYGAVGAGINAVRGRPALQGATTAMLTGTLIGIAFGLGSAALIGTTVSGVFPPGTPGMQP